MKANKLSFSFSIPSVILIIFTIILGGVFYSVHKTSEILIPFESNGSGTTLASPIADAPEQLPNTGLFGEKLASSVAEQSPATWYKGYKDKIKSRYAFKVTETSTTDTTTAWTGKTLCNGQPLSGVYIEDSTTGADGSFSVNVAGATAFYHPQYGTVVRSKTYNNLSGDIDFCASRGGNSKVDSKYFINPDNLEVKLSARVYDTDTSPSQGWEDEYVYLQCWTWNGQWNLRLNDWRKVNNGSEDMIPLFSLERGKRNYFVCRSYTYDQGQFAGPEWIRSGSTDPIQNYLPPETSTLAKLNDNIDSCRQVRTKGAPETLPAILKRDGIDPAILSYCQTQFPLLWDVGTPSFTGDEAGCRNYFSLQKSLIIPSQNRRNVAQNSRLSEEIQQLGLGTGFNSFCSSNYHYTSVDSLELPETTEQNCENVYTILSDNAREAQKDEALYIQNIKLYDPSIIEKCKAAFPNDWKPYFQPTLAVCGQIRSLDAIGKLRTFAAPSVGKWEDQEEHLFICDKAFGSALRDNFYYTENQCHQIAEWQYKGTLESESAARGYTGDKVPLCKELYPNYFSDSYQKQLSNFRTTGTISTDHIKLQLNVPQRAALINPGKFMDMFEKMYLTYADMVGGKPYGGLQIPVQSRCAYKGAANAEQTSSSCPWGSMNWGEDICD